MVYFNNKKLNLILNYKLGFYRNITLNSLKLKDIHFSINMKSSNLNYNKNDFDNFLILLTFLEKLVGQKIFIQHIKKKTNKEEFSNMTILLKVHVSDLKKVTFFLIILKLLNRNFLQVKNIKKKILDFNYKINFNYKNIYEILPYLEIEDNNVSFKLNILFNYKKNYYLYKYNRNNIYFNYSII
jgi:hypothetical protein